MKTDPFFSIIIPTYNRAGLIASTIQSVLAQTCTSYEIIVVDDGSEDGTEEIINNFSSSKIVFARKENEERGAARNYGWKKAMGNYVTFLDSDDVLYSNHLEEAYKFLSKEKDIACYAQAYEIKNAANGEILRAGYRFQQKTINKQILEGNFLSCFGVFIKKEIYSILNFDEDRKFSGTEDWLLWLQLSARYPFYYNNAVTGALLEHDHRSVLLFNEESLIYRAEMLRDKLNSDPAFMSTFGEKKVKNIYAHMLSYTSLHLAMCKEKRKAIRYWLKAININLKELLTRRTLSITKKIFFS
jgi:glycosyltransferase involved in cell wall biosynthesis